jgi:two-component system NtrC family response regulator/two-component system response regulator AtoC
MYGALPQQPSSILTMLFLVNPRVLFAKNGNDGSSHNSKFRRRILLVDDEKDVTAVFKDALKRGGYDVVVYNDSMAALAHFKPNQYDLAIFDVRMPGMGGFELYSKIRKIDTNIKALFVTAFAEYEHDFLVTLPDLDIKCVLEKPIHMGQLQDTVKEMLRDKK